MCNLKENHFGTARLLMKPLDCSFQGFACNKQVPDLKAQLCRKAANKLDLKATVRLCTKVSIEEASGFHRGSCLTRTPA
jgi:hypothetical protein